MSSLDDLDEQLEGSLYALPTDELGRAQAQIALERSDQFEARCLALRSSLAKDFAKNVHLANRTSEIYESNRIEGKLATLRETFEILEARSLFEADIAIASYTLTRALDEEAKVQDVVGLAAARILVDQFSTDREHPLTEADLRELHGMVLVGHGSAGRYKEYLNEIEGSPHTPIAPVDVPDRMNDLVRWFGSSGASGLWKAAVAHAWLTHIHPFDDGNGRMARLLANYTLGFGAYPPLIIKSSSDRGRYINALSHSDEAGDIVPLVRVFIRSINRQLTMMERPGFFWDLFQQDLRVREQSLFKRWRTTFDAFLGEIEAQLLLGGIRLDRVGEVSPSDFALLQSGDVGGNSWLAVTRSAGPKSLLLWVGYASLAVTRHLESDQVFPSIFLSEQNLNLGASHPYLPKVRGLPPRHDELCLIADENRAIIRRGEAVTTAGLTQAAELWASLLSNYLQSFARESGQ